MYGTTARTFNRSRLPGVFRTRLSQLDIRAGKRDGGVDGDCSSQRNNSCGSGNAKGRPLWAGHFRGLPSRRTPRGQRGNETKQIKQTTITTTATTTTVGLAICARAWKCFVPSLSLSDRVLPDVFFILRAGGYFNCIFIFLLINCN